jgi:hypothetical protein
MHHRRDISFLLYLLHVSKPPECQTVDIESYEILYASLPSSKEKWGEDRHSGSH